MNKDSNSVKIVDILENQIPDFILEENPNFNEFLQQYYISQEYQGGVVDLAENLTDYKNFSTFNTDNLVESTVLTSDINIFSETINVESTKGWPDKYGLLKIDNEIITYTGITTTSFTGCVRGFSGIEDLTNSDNSQVLTFSTSSSDDHSENSIVYNLSNLFLREFFKKIKSQYAPGFEEVEFSEQINPANFISRVRDFYQSKGTDEAYKILFKLLYNEDVKIIKPKDFCFTISDDQWMVVESLLCESVSGDPIKIKGQTLYQDKNESGSVLSASGSIYDVDKVYVNGKTFYRISIFSGYSQNLNPKGSILGKFLDTPKTFCTENISVGSNFITVDSTVGFGKTGTIIVNDSTVNYSDVTVNQFLNCTSIGSSITRGTSILGDNFVYSYTNGNKDDIVKLRIVNVLSGITSSNALNAIKDDLIRIENLGNIESSQFSNSLIYNYPLSIFSGEIKQPLTVDDKEGIDVSTGIVRTKYNHNLRDGDFIDLHDYNTDNIIKSSIRVGVSTGSLREFSINTVGISSFVGKKTLSRRFLIKTASTNYPEINNKYTANVQNIYSDEYYNYITSNGISNFNANPYKREVNFDTRTLNDGVNDYETLLGSHNFYDGELVTVKGYTVSGQFNNVAGIETGISLHVKKISEDEIKLAYSRSNVGLSSYINLSELLNPGISTSIKGYISSIELIDSDLYNSSFVSSKLFKKIPKTLEVSKEYEKTTPGPVGILINGVEIQNYKSHDKIYYGEIESINILNPGENYDLTNPPRFLVNAGIDTITRLIPQLSGSIKEISIIDSGFDYVDTPVVTIQGGGNNESVRTEVKTKLAQRELSFSAESVGGNVSTLDDLFIFDSPHGLNTGEPVVYQSFNFLPIGIGTEIADGYLVNNEVYYVINVGVGLSFRISNTRENALVNSFLPVREYGVGNQRFVSLNKRKVVDTVKVVDLNNNFKYKKIFARNGQVNHYDNIFSIVNHGFVENDEVIYTYEGSPLSGLSTNTYYYVDKIDEDRFSIKTSKQTSNVVNFGQSDSTSIHFFEYSPIRIKVSGVLASVGVTTVGTAASMTALVTGKVDEVKVLKSKNDYGSQSILNYKNVPTITELVGSESNLEPLINNGKIIKVIIKNKGKNYFNSIKLEVEGSGYGAKLEPILQNGKIISVSIVNPGVGYSSDTLIKITPLGRNLKLTANLQTWNLNQITKLGQNNISNGALLGRKYSSVGNVFGLYNLNSNYYTLFNIPRLSTGSNPSRHSPIIGWAYDGCPIYGPDGYVNIDGSGGFKRLRSSYRLNKRGPSSFTFIEDYEYVNGSGDLDDHNGRYCVTPEFPKGVYAYFCTLDVSRNPVFPYFVGDTFKYIPEKDNFNKKITQDIDLNSLDIIKYTLPCGVENKDHYYEYFDFNSKEYKSDIIVKKTSEGTISTVEVLNGGNSYKIKDKIVFDNSNTGGSGAYAEVFELQGNTINTVTSVNKNLKNICLYSENGNIVGIATTNHNLKDEYYVNVKNVSNSEYSELEGISKIEVETIQTELNESFGNYFETGLTTSIRIKGSIFDYEVDDLIKVDNEILTIIGIDKLNSRINVLREIGASSHSRHTSVISLPKKFTLDIKTDKNLTEKNQNYYFNPDQSVSIGIGTTPGSGNVKTIYPLGAGTSISKFIQHGGIFLPNNKFNSGDKVNYTPFQNSIQVYNFGSLDSLENIYIVKLEDDVIGLTTERTYSNSRDKLLLFEQNIDDTYTHKFETVKDIVTSEVFFNETTVSTAYGHNLEIGDTVKLNIVSGITTQYNVSYSSSTAKLLVNGQNNPKIEVYKNSTLRFVGLSSGTLLDTQFKLYTDPDYNNEYLGNQDTGIEVTKESNYLELKISEYTPQILYYNIESNTKKVFSDESVDRNNTIIINTSLYNLPLSIASTTTTSFVLNYPIQTERSSYNSSSASTLKYNILKSTKSSGPISKVKIISKGTNYKQVPKIKSITGNGNSSNLVVISDNIGKIVESKVIDNRLILPTDKTLRPFSYGYSSLFLYNNYKVDSITIEKTGRNYLNPPIINLYNRPLDRIVSDFSAYAEVKNGSISNIEVISQGSGLSSEDNEIVFTQNSNGIKVLGLQYDFVNKLATITLKTPVTDNFIGFSTNNPLPIGVGDSIFVEGIQSLNESGFNSSDHNYQYFEVTSVDPAFGAEDAATVTYKVSSINPVFGETSFNSSFVINSTDLPVARVSLIENNFTSGEFVNQERLLSNPNNALLINILKSENSATLNVNDQIVGNLSNSKAKIAKIENYSLKLGSDSSISRQLGWKKSQGTLSDITQKIPDNDYYQTFSYSLRSKKQLVDWNSIVSDLSHVSGYKKFGDLIIESSAGINSITSADSSNINLTLESYVDQSSIPDFDLGLENVDDYSGAYSDIITFNSKILSDNILSLQNRVLSIDDISNLFDTDLYPVVQIPIDQIQSNLTGNIVSKYLFFIQSSNSFLGELIYPLFFELLLTRDGDTIYLTSYSYFEVNQLGKIAAEIDAEDNSLINVYFVPNNNFNTLVFRAFREDVRTEVGFTTTQYGYNNNVAITTSYAAEVSPTQKTIYSVPISECTSGQFFIGISSLSSRIEKSYESTFLYNNSIIQTNVYTGDSYSGLGTVGIATSGSNIIVTYNGVPGIGVTIFGNFNFIKNTVTLPQEITDQFTRVNSSKITYTGSAQVAISTIPGDYSASKYIIEVTKTVGLSTQRSIVGLDLIHYNQDEYLNNINYGILGNFDDLNFETNFDLLSNSYVLSFIPSQSATYVIKFFEKNIYTLAE
jgi:hypothetical protein